MKRLSPFSFTQSDGHQIKTTAAQTVVANAPQRRRRRRWSVTETAPQRPPSQGRDTHFEVCMTPSLLYRRTTSKSADWDAPEKGVTYRFGVWLYGRARGSRLKQRHFVVRQSWGEVQRGEALSAPLSGSLFASFLPNSRKEVPARHERSSNGKRRKNKKEEAKQCHSDGLKSRKNLPRRVCQPERRSFLTASRSSG
jgi:hypothetical protein